MEASDELLARRAQQGSGSAFGELVQRYQRPILTLVLRMVRDRGRAEDLAQDAFVRAWRKLSTYDSSRAFRSWMFKIAHNLTLDELRRHQLDLVPLEGDDAEHRGPLDRLADPGVSAEERLTQRHAVAALERAIARLRPEYREVFLLRFQQDLSYEEIAEALEMPLGTVKTHLHRARKQLAGDLAAGGHAAGVEARIGVRSRNMGAEPTVGSRRS